MTRTSYIGAVSRDNEHGFFVDFGIMPQESENSNFAEAFNRALALQQEKKWDDSLNEYQKLIDLGRDAFSDSQAGAVYHNMAIIAAQKGDQMKAYIWAKKAVFLNPGNNLSREAYENYAKKVEIPSIPHQISNFDNLNKLLSSVPLDFWLIVSVILTLFSVRSSLKNLVERKKDRIAGVFEHAFPWKVYILGSAAAISITFSFFAYKRSQIATAVVLADKTPVQTVPGENKPVIFEAQAGLELEVLDSDSKFFKVRYPGAFTGWVNKSALELLSLSFRHEK